MIKLFLKIKLEYNTFTNEVGDAGFEPATSCV